MEICGKRQFELLEKMSFVRMGGTEQELAAANILMDEIKAMGLEPVLEPFEIEDADLVAGELEVLRPYNKKYVVRAYKLSENTPEEGLTAPFYYAENLTAVDLANCKGKIVLINGFTSTELYRKLLKAGALAFITMSGTMLETEENSDLFTRTLRETTRAFGNMPGANIRITDAFEIVKNEASLVKLTAINKPVTRTSHNIVVTIEGSEKPEEIISFGGHYDSVEFSKGAHDNAAGSVINMEILRYFNENKPKRTVKVMWYGAEEMGLLGSKAWIKAHEDELDRHLCMINTDMAGVVIGYDVARVIASKEATAHCDAFMRRKGYNVGVTQELYSSDSVPFADKGVPAINFIRFGHHVGGTFIHCRNDVKEFLSEKALAKTTKYVLDYGVELVESVVFPFDRTVPAEMKEKIDKYLAKKEMEEAKAAKKDK
ncbi:MAG: M20/M25/M40 family metallo-hydrolase [Oscillospiraceae bacterium]|nr:M20/M25/M40 family metallo-hydrolase [Oscillospiraceae bacterium]